MVRQMVWLVMKKSRRVRESGSAMSNGVKVSFFLQPTFSKAESKLEHTDYERINTQRKLILQKETQKTELYYFNLFHCETPFNVQKFLYLNA